jgi:alanine-synthesizing transaminase
MFSRRTEWNLATNRLTQAQERLRAAGREVLDLTASNPTTVGLHYDQQAILTALVSDASLHYTPAARGLLSARQAVAQYYRERDGLQVDAERILLTTSTSEAYSFIFRLLCDPDDEVLVPVPSYPLFEFLAGLQDVRLTPYPLFYDHGWHFDLYALERALTPKSRAVLVVHPNNPTGSFLKDAEAEALRQFCAAHQLALIADEVFLDFTWSGSQRRSFAAPSSALTFALSGLSKICALPQMKVAWLSVSGSDALVEPALARLEVIADTYLSMNAPIQHAVAQLLEQRFSLQRQMLDRVAANLAELDRQLARQSASERLVAEGGWYAVLRVPATRSDEDLAVEILEKEAVLVHPGHFYDFPREGYLVISLIADTDEFRDAIPRLLALVG